MGRAARVHALAMVALALVIGVLTQHFFTGFTSQAIMEIRAFIWRFREVLLLITGGLGTCPKLRASMREI